jgi:hypothetical protein
MNELAEVMQKAELGILVIGGFLVLNHAGRKVLNWLEQRSENGGMPDE